MSDEPMNCQSRNFPKELFPGSRRACLSFLFLLLTAASSPAQAPAPGALPAPAKATAAVARTPPQAEPEPVSEAAPHPFRQSGRIVPRSASGIAASDWSIGCEVLDRDFASYAAYRTWLGPLGAKAARLQAGWAKTEKTPGVYDWRWLDEVLDDIIAQGVRPWVQLSYGNPAYKDGGGINIGDTGPTSPEALAGWDAWATALIRRYRDRVGEWEIWNESDIFKKMTLEQYVDLFIRTGDIIRAEQPGARIYALSLAHKADYAQAFLKAVQARGKLGLVDAITFHSYPHNPDDLKTWKELKAVVAAFPAKIELRQGETGAPSGKTTGALGGYDWTELKQAKWNLRRMFAHHANGVPFNLFTLSEFFYPKGRNAKGLLQIREDLSVVGPKPAYFAAQTVFALFDAEWVPDAAPSIKAATAEPVSAYAYRRRVGGASFVLVWLSGKPPEMTNTYVPTDVAVSGASLDDPVLVDLRTGAVLEFPAGAASRAQDGAWSFRSLPLYDAPLLIAGRAALGGVAPVDRHATWSPFAFGAKGDGVVPDTVAIQAAIDACHAAGGGRVVLAGGRFRSGTLRLRDNVVLHIEAGATLLASTNLADFPSTPSRHPTYTGEFVTGKMFLHAEDARNIGIEGRGTVDGGGETWAEGPYGSPSFHYRPRLLHFAGCENVQIRGVTFRNSASWTLSFLECRDLVLEGIRIDSRENPDIEAPRFARAKGRNCDGIDLIDCQTVRLSNCLVNSGDDAIVLKSFSPGSMCRDIVISNCVVSSNASGIKIGTESAGAFEDIVVQNCVVHDTRCEGLAVLTVDGARIERVSFSNIALRNIKGDAILVRLGARNRAYRKDVVPGPGTLRNVQFSQIQGTRISDLGNAIAGLPGQPVENLVLRDIAFEFTGGGTAAEAARQVPENAKGYPGVALFGKLPAYGFFVRHARNVVFENVRLSCISEDRRPAVVCDDVDGLALGRIDAGTAAGVEPVRLIGTRSAAGGKGSAK